MEKPWLLPLLMLGLVALLSGCGGGSDDTGSQPLQPPSSNWDNMTWDQSNWS